MPDPPTNDHDGNTVEVPLLFDILNDGCLNESNPVLLPRVTAKDNASTSAQPLDKTPYPLAFKSLVPLGTDGPLTSQGVRKAVETQFLTPSPIFPEHWLQSSQTLPPREPDLSALVELPNISCTTSIELTRNLLTNQVCGGQQTTRLHSAVGDRYSTSFTRPLTDPKDFTLGKLMNVPFVPGGLDPFSTLNLPSLSEIQSSDNDTNPFDLEPEKLLDTPPGFIRGASFTDASHRGTTWRDMLSTEELTVNWNAPSTSPEVDSVAEQVLALAVTEEPGVDHPSKEPSAETGAVSYEDEDSATRAVSALLPEDTQSAMENPTMELKTTAKPIKREWAHMVDISRAFTNFYELVPQLAHQFPFELDVFQKQAVYHLEQGDSVFVAAHTSAGKTVVAEYAIAMAMKHMTKAIYTSPIKALSNQKFRDFRETFGKDNVGILTGDIQIQPEAPCLVMTTEILRSMLYRGADLIRDVEFVIFDEVHYINDSERGVVWEEVIIMLPAHINLILLSATVPNTREFADWVGRTKKKDIYVVSTSHRPVPLEHFLYVNNDIYKVVDAQRSFQSVGWKKAHDNHTSTIRREKERAMAKAKAAAINQRGRGRGYHIPQPSFHQRKSNVPDRTLWVHLCGFLRQKQLLPVVIFTFSRKRCEEYAAGLNRLDLNTAKEKSAIHHLFSTSLARLREVDRDLPQIMRVKEQMIRGVAVHHGGLLPIIKEVVELAFSRGLVKILFATETFAMGVNMPTRTVVFSALRKHDGRTFRDLLPGEYTQMSGRAGRRGLDSTGTVIIVCPGDIPDSVTLQEIILGPATKLQSQFRLTYTMILNLLRVEALRVEDMLKRSFSENLNQKEVPTAQTSLKELQDRLEAVPRLTCEVCDPDMYTFQAHCDQIQQLRRQLYRAIGQTPLASNVWSTGRVIVAQRVGRRPTLGVILRPVGGIATRSDVPSTMTLSAALHSVPTTTRQYLCLLWEEPLDDSTLWPADSTVVGGDPPRYPFLNYYHDGLEHDALRHHPFSVYPAQPPSETKPTIVLQTLGVESFALTSRATLRLDLSAALKSSGGSEGVRIRQEILNQLESDERTILEEFDWGAKTKELDFQLSLRQMLDLQRTLPTLNCLGCPHFVEHYALVDHRERLTTQLQSLSHSLSEQNLTLLPDYQVKLDVLHALDCIDNHNIVRLKGQVACCINVGHELVLTELILNNVFARYAPPEIAALLSCFVFQDRHVEEPELLPSLQEVKETLVDTTRKVAQVQDDCGVFDVSVESAVEDSLCFGLMEVTYEWARGMNFKQITQLTEVQEGSIVRAIVRLDDTCRDIKNAARVVGDSHLYRKMEEVSQLVKRDIVFAASLYF